ncbi:ABC transporter substrate-binding protein [Brevibacillus sp. SYSU BS000544]|uniref:ABC transporter substrate-binding protein n=1 Tax=Brevibacillus sp. SYSU BS000544 TaxID=3416443 RepID=UPI003CE4EA1F
MKSMRRKLVGNWMLLLLLALSLVYTSACSQQTTAPNETQKTATPTETKQSQEQKRVITDMANRQVEVPAKVNKVYSSAPTGTILIYSLAPEKMVGWNYQLRNGERKFVLEQYHNLPNLGGWYSSNTGNKEEILKAAPDVIISFGTTRKKDAEQADEIQKQLGIPVVVIDSELTKLDQAFAFAGELLGVQEKAAELGAYCKQSVEDVVAKSKQLDDSKRVRVYYAEGAKGLETDPKGSPHTQVLELVGGINVADVEMKQGKGLSQVSIEQVIKWNPDVIISWDDERGGYYSGIAKDPTWQGIQAVKDKKIYEIPTSPFNWFDRPPSVNRVLGIKWLGNLLYPELYPYDMKAEVKEFYKKFYHYDLTDKEVNELLMKASSK